ncbi:MFS transporter [Streptococcus sp. Marseille-Q5986]|uniref:MFS transporter n=1 Tax=Streptococcus sp. Marseille-Q5986 TaxID=2972782 RepID=UPI0022650ECA|nr:MFS transporter [Streptococcus sp. Marseille-Q5986]
MISRKFSQNFINLILGRSSRNIADSFYFIALSIGLVSVYHIEAGQLSLFTLIGFIPNLLAVFYGSFINKIQRDKIWLVIFQIIQLIIILITILCLRYHFHVMYIYVLNFLFALSTNLLNTLQMKIVPETLNNDDVLIKKSIDVQYLASNVLDIISNLTASLLLGLLSYFVVFNLSIPFFVAAIYFMIKIRLLGSKNNTKSVQPGKVDLESNSSFQFLETISAFRESKFASFIVVTESILSGGTDLLLTLMPLYLLSEGIPIQYLGLVLGVQRFADLIGAILAPRMRIPYKMFFFIDYTVSGLALILVFITPFPLIKLLLFFLAFIIIGISGNMFEKMIYSEYRYDTMGLIYSTNSSLYALFAILFLIIPQFYTDIKILGILINGFTLFIGIYLLVICNFFKKKDTNY